MNSPRIPEQAESVAYMDFMANKLAPLQTVMRTVRDLSNGQQCADLSCGHVSKVVPHFAVKVNSKLRCRECGMDAAIANEKVKS